MQRLISLRLGPLILLLAMALLGGATVVAHLWSADRTRDDALVLNLAGRERLLLEKSVVEAVRGALEGHDAETHQDYHHAQEEFESNLAVLVEGGPAAIGGRVADLPPATGAFRRALEGMEGRLPLLHARAHAVLEAPPGSPESARALRDLEEVAASILDEMDAAVAVYQGQSEARLALWRNLVLGFTLAGFLLLLVVLWLANRYLVRPVDALQLAVRRIEWGDLETPVLVSTANELGDLARALEAMRVTRRAAEEDELARSRDRLQERMRAMEQMVSGIAHGFNNALVPVVGFSDLLLAQPEALENRAELRQYLELINTGAQDASSIVRRLSSFYRQSREAEATAVLDLGGVVEEAVSLTAPRWKTETQARGLSIEVRVASSDAPAVAGKASELREVLVNLIFNAVDAMPDGGTIDIRTFSEGEYAVTEVADTGEGMPEEVLRHCLDPFYTTKGDRGTGLGLAMVEGVARQHGGEVEVASELGKGTTFTLRLPLQGGQVVEGAGPREGPATGRLHVLVADDDPMALALATQYLVSDGHTVETASTGTEALEMFVSGGFDLVLTDNAMPGMSGHQLAADIRATAATPVIVMSGFDDSCRPEDARPPGVDLVMEKPFTLVELRRAVARVTGG